MDKYVKFSVNIDDIIERSIRNRISLGQYEIEFTLSPVDFVPDNEIWFLDPVNMKIHKIINIGV